MAALLIEGGLIQFPPCDQKLAPRINIEAELEELIAKSRAEAGINNATSSSRSRKPSPTTPSTAKPSKKGSPSHSSPNLASDLKSDTAVPSLTDNERTMTVEEYDTSDDDCGIPSVTEALRDMTLDPSISRRFHGKSSGMAPLCFLRATFVTLWFQLRVNAHSSCQGFEAAIRRPGFVVLPKRAILGPHGCEPLLVKQLGFSQ